MVEAPPAQAPALEEDPAERFWSNDDLVLRALVRAPFNCHGTLRAVSQRVNFLLRSDDFRKQRLEFGLAEHGVVVAGGRRHDDVIADCWMLWNGRWRPIPPMSGPRSGACSVVIDNEMWVRAVWSTPRMITRMTWRRSRSTALRRTRGGRARR